jgi:hypothetical protein
MKKILKIKEEKGITLVALVVTMVLRSWFRLVQVPMGRVHTKHGMNI